MKQDNSIDAAKANQIIILATSIAVICFFSVLKPILVGELYSGSITGSIHELDRPVTDMLYVVDIGGTEVKALFDKPVLINQKVFAFCSGNPPQSGSNCTGYEWEANKLHMLLSSVKYILVYLIIILALIMHRNRILNKCKQTSA